MIGPLILTPKPPPFPPPSFGPVPPSTPPPSHLLNPPPFVPVPPRTKSKSSSSSSSPRCYLVCKSSLFPKSGLRPKSARLGILCNNFKK